MIDDLVQSCREGQGQIGPDRARAGRWNQNNTDQQQQSFNELLDALTPPQREVLAQLLQHVFMSGVHETLRVLHEAGVAPFDDAYEGTPFHDFIGRLDGWEWPTS